MIHIDALLAELEQEIIQLTGTHPGHVQKIVAKVADIRAALPPDQPNQPEDDGDTDHPEPPEAAPGAE